MTWAEAQEAGLVYLPATGRRDGSSVSNVGVRGNYWSSSAYGSNIAYSVSFNSSNVFPDNCDSRNYGYSVRLITECQ